MIRYVGPTATIEVDAADNETIVETALMREVLNRTSLDLFKNRQHFMPDSVACKCDLSIRWIGQVALLAAVEVGEDLAAPQIQPGAKDHAAVDRRDSAQPGRVRPAAVPISSTKY